ncbi:MAG: ABC transporter ATP-binding protein [Nitrospinae bacterium]|nr:ABC transporter ATP-binding protein [Nitrospinota bacterium]
MSEIPTIKVENVTKTFRLTGETITALKDISFAICAGEFIVAAGPSGSGKSTLLHLLGALDVPDKGKIMVNGRDIAVMSESLRANFRRYEIGFVFQTFSLIPVLTVYENVEYALLLKGVTKGQRKRMVMETLTTVGLERYATRYPRQLSGGQQQRVAVCRAIAGQCTYILADEPTANLDAKNAMGLMEIMRQLNIERKVTFIISSHDPRVISKAERVIYLEDGALRDSTI